MSLTAFDIARLPRILFGPGRIAEVPAQAAAWGRRVLLVTGGRSFFGTGRWEQLLSGLQAQGLEWRYTQVLEEPSPLLVDTAVQELGGLAVLVNNAGITRDTTMHRMTYEQWEAVIQTNLTSCFNMSRAVIEGMRERGFGRVVCISSINGQKGQMGQSNYSAAKAGLIGFTKALAQENAFKGITVNAVAPGYIATEMVQAVPEEVLKTKILPLIPVGRLGHAEEIARGVSFLVAEDAGFITGSTLSVNGGQHMY